MIKIKRSVCPNSLQKRDKSFVKGDYARDDVKTALLKMQYGKCCYCERRIIELSPTEREVDHYIPRKAFVNGGGNIQWHKANKWENLLFSCVKCNRSKAGKHPCNQKTGETEIIDPSCEDIDPEDHITFNIEDALISYVPQNGSTLGNTTIEKLALCERIDLFAEFRKKKCEIDMEFAYLINSIVIDDDISIDSQKQEIEKTMSAHVAYAAFIRCYIKWRLKKLNTEEIPKLVIKHKITPRSINIRIPKGFETGIKGYLV